MKYYAVIDTNVLVSAIMFAESAPGKVLDQALHGAVIPLISDNILTEYRDVLNRPKFSFDGRTVNVLLDGIVARGLHIEEVPFDEFMPDEKDAVFYEVVMEARKEHDAYLVTGNLKHFPSRSFVVTPREMWDIILGKTAVADKI